MPLYHSTFAGCGNLLKLDIIFCRVDETCSQGILGRFMSIVDIELSEDVLAMSVDSMKAGETFFGYFLGRHTESDVY